MKKLILPLILLLCLPALAVITYPVSQDSKFVVAEKATTNIVAKNISWPRTDGQPIVNMDTNYVILEVVIQSRPAYDSSSNKLEKVETPDIPNEEYVMSWNVIPLSTNELAELAVIESATAEKEIAKSFYQNLKNHSGTSEERVTRLENVVAWLLKEVANEDDL